MDTLPFVSHEQILRLNLPLHEIFAAIEAAFVEHGKGRVEMPPKIGVHTRPGTFIHAMPAYVPALNICGMKWISGYPQNPERGLPTIAGVLLLNDPDTGLLLGAMDARWITGVRTAVVSALIVRTCGRSDARSLAVAGCGMQGREHLRCCLHVLPNVQEVRLFDVREENAHKLRDDSAAWTRATVKLCKSPEECLRGAEVSATCTSGQLEVQDDWLPRGGTAVGVDSHIAWGRLFKTIDKFIMDDEKQAREFEKRGKYPGGLPPIHAELGQILAGQKSGRENEAERILGLPLGLAIADLAVGQLIWQRTK